MKTIKFSKKLKLHKETIADLHSKEMKAIQGGKGPEPNTAQTLCGQFTCPYCPGITNLTGWPFCCM